MDKDNLVRILRELLTSERVSAARVAATLPSGLETGLLLHTLAQPISAALSAQKPFREGGFLVQRDSGYTGFYSNEAAIGLARRVLAGETPEQAADWLEKVFATSEAPGFGILALTGITIEAPVDLGSGVVLQPLESLPDSSTKAWLSKGPDLSSPSSLLTWMHQFPPRAALVARDVIRPFLHPTKDGPAPQQSDPLRLRSLLDDARLALTLVGPASPVSAGYWFQFEDPDLSEAYFYGGVMTTYEEVSFGFTETVALDPLESQEVCSAFLTLEDPLRSRLRLALRRLNQAIRRAPHGDRALDLAIALESLLGDKDPSESTYKIALRAALILNVPLEDRREVRAKIGALYSLRSRVVHDGALPEEVKVRDFGKRDSAEFVMDATRVTAKLLRAILAGRSIPEWFTFELNGGAWAGASAV